MKENSIAVCMPFSLKPPAFPGQQVVTTLSSPQYENEKKGKRSWRSLGPKLGVPDPLRRISAAAAYLP